MGILTLTMLTAGAAAAVPQDGLEASFRQHVRAVQTRDLRELERTITTGRDFLLILPDGRRTMTRAEYIAVHKRLFDTPGWSITFEPVSRLVTRDLAIITTRSVYREARDDPQASVNWVTFVFRRENARWRLVADQNTRVP